PRIQCRQLRTSSATSTSAPRVTDATASTQKSAALNGSRRRSDGAQRLCCENCHGNSCMRLHHRFKWCRGIPRLSAGASTNFKKESRRADRCGATAVAKRNGSNGCAGGTVRILLDIGVARRNEDRRDENATRTASK